MSQEGGISKNQWDPIQSYVFCRSPWTICVGKVAMKWIYNLFVYFPDILSAMSWKASQVEEIFISKMLFIKAWAVPSILMTIKRGEWPFNNSVLALNQNDTSPLRFFMTAF